MEGRDNSGAVVAIINLSRDTITLPSEAYSAVAFSTDAGNKWSDVKATTFENFPKMLTTDFELWLTDKYEKETRNPPSDANIVKFAKINARPKAPSLIANYTVGSTLADKRWALTEKEGTQAVVAGIGIAPADSTGKTIGSEGYGTYYDGIFLNRSSSNKTKVQKYFIRNEPYFDGTAYTAASIPKAISVKGEQKAPKKKANYKTETIKLNKGDVIFAGTLEELAEIDYWDVREISENTAILEAGQLLYVASAKRTEVSISGYLSEEAQTVVIWGSGTDKKPPTAKQVYTLAPRTTLETLNLSGKSGKLSLDSRFQILNKQTNKWGKLPKITANQTFDIRSKSTAKATGAVDKGFAASKSGDLNISWGVFDERKNKSGILQAIIRPRGEGQNYSITGVTVNRSENIISAEVSTGVADYVDITVLEDVVGESDDWDTAKELAVGNASVGKATEATFIDVPMSDTLPTYFIIVVRLRSTNGAELCSPFTSIEYTSAHEEFLTKTVDDFADHPGEVIRLDDVAENNNFMVTAEGVPFIDADPDDVDVSEDGNTYVFNRRFGGRQLQGNL
ncbi:hypothetical protein FACS1894217_11140 [Clostridia bacterium]|nr:hypothetical protein FACS1894217_11140 [Clostridia bacterium]